MSYRNVVIHIALPVALVGLAVLAFAFTAANAPQCDNGVVQTNCIVGANIGRGLLILLGYFLLGVSALIAVVASILWHFKKERIVK